MYFEDMTPYSYSAERFADDAPSMVNFGWLDASHEYSRGEVPPGLVNQALALAADYTNAMRGFHCCPFCRERTHMSMLLGDQPVYLGHSEIRIRVGDTTYVAPSLLPHYMAAHNYMPPAEVIRALGGDLPAAGS
jgi:hypothetical protein